MLWRWRVGPSASARALRAKLKHARALTKPLLPVRPLDPKRQRKVVKTWSRRYYLYLVQKFRSELKNARALTKPLLLVRKVVKTWSRRYSRYLLY